jgi:hypothetical protein
MQVGISEQQVSGGMCFRKLELLPDSIWLPLVNPFRKKGKYIFRSSFQKTGGLLFTELYHSEKFSYLQSIFGSYYGGFSNREN